MAVATIIGCPEIRKISCNKFSNIPTPPITGKIPAIIKAVEKMIPKINGASDPKNFEISQISAEATIGRIIDRAIIATRTIGLDLELNILSLDSSRLLEKVTK